MAKETVNILKDKIDIVELLAQLNATYNANSKNMLPKNITMQNY